MTNPYRAMCAELLEDLEIQLDELRFNNRLCIRARALLDQPVAEGVLPLKERPDFIAGYREGLADRRRITECEEAERPAAQPVAEEPTDDEIEEWADACSEAPLEEMDPEIHGWRRCFTAKEFSETIRAALARWGRPTPQPVAVSERLPGPEDCEAGECWGWDVAAEAWNRTHYAVCNHYTHWLPANALPTPEAKP